MEFDRRIEDRGMKELETWTRGQFDKLMVILTGVHGTNGLKGDVDKLKERCDAMEDDLHSTAQDIKDAVQWGKDLWNIKRHEPGQCLGIAAVEALEMRLKEAAEVKDKAVLEMKKARLALYGGLGIAFLSTAGQIAVSILNRIEVAAK